MADLGNLKQIEELRKRVRELEEALQPFSQDYKEGCPSKNRVQYINYCSKAHEALSSPLPAPAPVEAQEVAPDFEKIADEIVSRFTRQTKEGDSVLSGNPDNLADAIFEALNAAAHGEKATQDEALEILSRALEVLDQCGDEISSLSADHLSHNKTGRLYQEARIAESRARGVATRIQNFLAGVKI